MRRDRSRAQLLALLLLGACSLLSLDLPPVRAAMAGLFGSEAPGVARTAPERVIASPAPPPFLRDARLLRGLAEHMQRAETRPAPGLHVHWLHASPDEGVQPDRKSSG